MKADIMFFLYILFLTDAFGMPLTNLNNDLKDDPKSTISMDEVFDYLTKYGYLVEKRPSRLNGVPPNKKDYNIANPKSSIYYKTIEVETALKEFQQFMGLKETSQLNLETIEMMRRPRCGQPDRVARDILSFKYGVNFTAKGRAKNATYNASSYSMFSGNTYNAPRTLYWVLPNFFGPSKMSLDLATYAFQYAANRWSAVCNVNFKQVLSRAEADIVVSFETGDHGDGKPFDGAGGELAHVKPGTKNLHFDKDEKFKFNHYNTFYFKRPNALPDYVQVAIHEVGHILGFSHSNNKNSVMHATISNNFKYEDIYRLHDSDVALATAKWGTCYPPRFDSIFSDLHNGKTYININYFTYQVSGPKPEVDQSWPRLTYSTFYGFDKVDEFFMHDRMIYMAKGEWYRFDWAGAYSPLYKFSEKFHPNLDRIDAAFTHVDNKLYLIRKDMVYRWDPNLPTKEPFTYPTGDLEKGWPKKLQDVFPGAPSSPDTVFRWYTDGKVYFFKGREFQEFDPKKNKMSGPKYSLDKWKYVCDSYLCLSYDSCYHWGKW